VRDVSSVALAKEEVRRGDPALDGLGALSFSIQLDCFVVSRQAGSLLAMTVC
jgi:hypothetical protein